MFFLRRGVHIGDHARVVVVGFLFLLNNRGSPHFIAILDERQFLLLLGLGLLKPLDILYLAESRRSLDIMDMFIRDRNDFGHRELLFFAGSRQGRDGDHLLEAAVAFLLFIFFADDLDRLVLVHHGFDDGGSHDVAFRGLLVRSDLGVERSLGLHFVLTLEIDGFGMEGLAGLLVLV